MDTSILRELHGFGSFEDLQRGRVHLLFRGERLSDHQRVVLKTLRSEFPDERAVASLRHEYAVLESLDVPGAAVTIGLKRVHGLPGLLLEDCGHIDLLHHLQKTAPKGMSLIDFFHIALPLTHTVHELHTRGIVHRDINPSNIVLNEHLSPTLVDFGSALTLSQFETDFVPLSEVEGTLAYLAPEQSGRTGRPTDLRSDLYAIGATFYEMLSGHPPFEGHDSLELLHAHLTRRPPSLLEKRPSIPAPLASVVDKLLAKEPELRYQSARALHQDLLQLKRLYAQTSSPVASSASAPNTPTGMPSPSPAFVPSPDLPRGLQWFRLYGRNAEMSELQSTLVHTLNGTQEVVFISGPPGVGKTALARQLYQPVAARRGYFAIGRFEAQAHHRPYQGIFDALHWLVQNALTWPTERLQPWLMQVTDELGPLSALLPEVSPDFRGLLGDRPLPSPLGAAEIRIQLRDVVRTLLASFAHEQSPLILFLDDVQLADDASLSLMEYLILEAEIPYLLIILSYRDGNDLPANVANTLHRLVEEHPTIRQITPGLLSPEQVTEMLAELLIRSAEDVSLLARRIHQHTRGSPLFIQQLLGYLEQEGSLTQLDSGHWEWDVQRIELLELRDDAVDLMLRELERLPPQTLEVLIPAAGLGESFELELLAEAVNKSALDVADALWPAVTRGLLLPLQASYQVLRRSDAMGDELQGLHAVFRFLHARVAQAVWGTLASERRESVQLALGRVCLNAWRQHGNEERLFDALYHLQQATALLSDPSERLDCAALYLKGAAQARESGAYRSSLEFARHGIELLPVNAWQEHRPLTMALHQEGAVAAFLEGNHENARTWLARALGHTDALEQQIGLSEGIELHSLLIQDLCATGDFVEAIAAGRVALDAIGTPLPVDRFEEVFDHELEEVLTLMEQGALEELQDRTLVAPLPLAEVTLLSHLSVAGYFSNQPLLNFSVVRIAHLALIHGCSRHVIHPLAYLGFLIMNQRGDTVRGHAVGRTAVLLSQHSTDSMARGRALHVFGNHVNHWRAPLQSSAQLLREAITCTLAAGDMQFAAYATSGLCLNLISQGEALSEVLAEVANGLNLARKQANQPVVLIHQLVLLYIRWLQSLTPGLGAGGAQAQADELEALSGADHTVVCLSLFFRLSASVLVEDWPTAGELCTRIEAYLPHIAGLPLVADVALLVGVTAARHLDAAMKDELTASEDPLFWRDLMERSRTQLAHYAQDCPYNFAHKLHILDGELLLLEGRTLDAADLFEQAAQEARASGFVRDEALAHELGGRVWWNSGRRLTARGHLEAAIRCYALWGASRKVTAMARQFPDLELPSRSGLPSIGPDTENPSPHEPSPFDLISLMKASASIISELELNRLMERLLGVVLETAGAEYAALILLENERLWVRAVLDPTRGQFVVQSTPLEQSEAVSAAMVSYARRTARPLVIGAAEASGLFRDDPYVQRRRPRSVLCLPMVHRTRLIGVLYLENNLLPHAFNSRRLELLGLLSTQLAVALENGRLYDGLQREIGERTRAEEALRQLNAGLEQRVAERTRTLERLNGELEQFAYITSHDLQEPLRTITGFLGMLEEDYGPQLPTEARYFVRTAVEGATRMRDLIRDLLSYSKVGGNQPPVPTSLMDCMLQVKQNLRRALDESNATLEYSDLPVVMATSRELVQLLQNLCSNALKFRSNVPPLIRITGHVLPPDENAVLWYEMKVQDNGIGIDPAHHHKIFQVFQRLHVREQYPGNGIGLAIVRKVVERQGGSIRVESNKGSGAVFVFTLPLAVAAPPAESVDEREGKESDAVAAGG